MAATAPPALAAAKGVKGETGFPLNLLQNLLVYLDEDIFKPSECPEKV